MPPKKKKPKAQQGEDYGAVRQQGQALLDFIEYTKDQLGVRDAPNAQDFEQNLLISAELNYYEKLGVWAAYRNAKLAVKKPMKALPLPQLCRQMTWMVNLVEAMQSGDLDWNDRVCEVLEALHRAENAAGELAPVWLSSEAVMEEGDDGFTLRTTSEAVAELESVGLVVRRKGLYRASSIRWPALEAQQLYASTDDDDAGEGDDMLAEQDAREAAEAAQLAREVVAGGDLYPGGAEGDEDAEEEELEQEPEVVLARKEAEAAIRARDPERAQLADHLVEEALSKARARRAQDKQKQEASQVSAPQQQQQVRQAGQQGSGGAGAGQWEFGEDGWTSSRAQQAGAQLLALLQQPQSPGAPSPPPPARQAEATQPAAPAATPPATTQKPSYVSHFRSQWDRPSYTPPPPPLPPPPPPRTQQHPQAQAPAAPTTVNTNSQAKARDSTVREATRQASDGQPGEEHELPPAEEPEEAPTQGDEAGDGPPSSDPPPQADPKSAGPPADYNPEFATGGGQQQRSGVAWRRFEEYRSQLQREEQAEAWTVSNVSGYALAEMAINVRVRLEEVVFRSVRISRASFQEVLRADPELTVYQKLKMAAAWRTLSRLCHSTRDGQPRHMVPPDVLRLEYRQVLDLRRWLRYHVWQLVEPVPVVEGGWAGAWVANMWDKYDAAARLGQGCSLVLRLLALTGCLAENLMLLQLAQEELMWQDEPGGAQGLLRRVVAQLIEDRFITLQQRVASNQRDPLSGRYLVLNIPRTEIGRCDPETAARLANAQGLGMR